MGTEVIIIGGGLAGLAAASALADRDVPLTLLESRPRLGGRAASFTDRTTGLQIDNCQHVSMGCCTNFRKFCNSVGQTSYFRCERQLNFIGPDGTVNPLSAGLLPAPLHLWSGFRRLSYLSRRDKSGLSRGLRRLARTDPSRWDGQSFADWLNEQRQTQTAIERFWRVVLVSALSETLDRIDVTSARKVFVDAFLANRQGWEVQIPTVPLDRLYGLALTDWLERRGASIRLSSGVERIVVEHERAVAVELRGGLRLAADEFILAVPYHLAGSLLPDALRGHPQLAGLEKLESASISSLHLWFDRPITELPHAVLIDRLGQWMFNRTVLQRERGGAAPCVIHQPANAGRSPNERIEGEQLFNYQIVISASRNLADLSQQQVVDAVVREMTEIWPATADARLMHQRMVTEHRAVFSVKPGSEQWRPAQQSPIANLQFAGDWTRTGWPATMEGAVRSGYLAAENVLSHLGSPEKLLAPDLTVARLSKLLLGL